MLLFVDPGVWDGRGAIARPVDKGGNSAEREQRKLAKSELSFVPRLNRVGKSIRIRCGL